MPRLVARLRTEAPGIQVHIRTLDPRVADALETGRLDLAIGVFARISEVFSRETLFLERMVWALRADHPAAREPVSMKTLQRLPLVVLTPGNESAEGEQRTSHLIEPRVLWDELASDQAPLGRGARQRIRAVVDNAHAVMAIIGSSDLVGLAPRRLAMSRCEALGLKLIELPDPSPGAAIEAVWRADQSAHPALSWLRGILAEAARDA